jgi:hypothetical protein
VRTEEEDEDEEEEDVEKEDVTISELTVLIQNKCNEPDDGLFLILNN